MAVQRAGPDPRAAGDLVERGLDALLDISGSFTIRRMSPVKLAKRRRSPYSGSQF
jgi:hypothetical protein